DAGHLLVLAHLLAQPGDLIDPFVVHLGHREVVERVAEWHEVVDVIVVVALEDDVDHRIEDGTLLHRWLGRRRLDVLLDLLRNLLEAVHIQDLLPDLVLVGLDAAVGIDLLSPEVFGYLDRPLAEKILLEDVGEARLRIDREDEHLVPLAGQPVAGGGGEGGLPQASLAAEHDVAALRMALEKGAERSRCGWCWWCYSHSR